MCEANERMRRRDEVFKKQLTRSIKEFIEYEETMSACEEKKKGCDG
jgi:hypothetical protein